MITLTTDMSRGLELGSQRWVHGNHQLLLRTLSHRLHVHLTQSILLQKRNVVPGDLELEVLPWADS